MGSETYRNAPITEAALDVRVRLPKDVGLDVLEAVRDENYPVLHRRPVKIDFKVIATDSDPLVAPKSEISNTPLGVAYATEDRRQVFQIRTDGFTHNRLEPYVDWESFSQEAKRLWARYAALARPETIEILGLNYLNQIPVPLGAPFENYFRTYIQVAPDLPQTVNSYNLNFQLSWPGEEGILAFVGQSLAPSLKEGFVAMVLNIQAFKQLNKPATEVQEDEIWKTFNTLRDIKNSVFEACITDLVRKEIR
jgi:uncharacterized protein (TIGR04255 family)